MAQTTVPKFLILDSSSVCARLLTIRLSHLRYHADVSATPEEAFASLADTPYTALIMECNLGRISGLEILRTIRTSNTNYRHIYAIAQTADLIAFPRAVCLGAGMNDHLDKPIRLPALYASIHRAVAYAEKHNAILAS